MVFVIIKICCNEIEKLFVKGFIVGVVVGKIGYVMMFKFGICGMNEYKWELVVVCFVLFGVFEWD